MIYKDISNESKQRQSEWPQAIERSKIRISHPHNQYHHVAYPYNDTLFTQNSLYSSIKVFPDIVFESEEIERVTDECTINLAK